MKFIFKKLKTKNFIWLPLLALVLSILFNAAMILPTHAQPDAKVFVDPKDNIYYTYEKGINDTIQINVTIANMTGLAGLEFKLEWDSSLLNATDMVENLFATVTPPGEEGNIWPLTHSVGSGGVHYAYTYQNLTRAFGLGYAPINITTAEGYPEGKLAAAIITLQIIAEPPPDDFLDCILDITVSKPGYAAPPLGPGGQIPHTLEHGYYKLIAPPLPTPILKVDPEIYEATYRNETFDINVTINNLDAGWQVVGVEFKLRYDPALLAIKNVTEGPFMATFAEPPNQGTMFMGPVYGSDYVLVGIVILADENGTWHEPFPSGNGTIATIAFQVIQGPSTSVNLELFDTKVGDIYANPINHTAEVGVFIFNVEILYHNIVVYGEPFVVTTASNATISPVPMMILPRYKTLTFNATGADGAQSFVNITIPSNLLWLEEPTDTWLVLVGGYQVTPTVGGNDTHTWLYFTFTTNQKPIQIVGTSVIPEFPTSTFLILLLLSTSLIAVITKVVYTSKVRKTQR